MGSLQDEYREAELSTARAAICVFDDYVIDRSGATGKVLLAIWPESINFYGAYLMKDDVIESIEQHDEFRVEE